MPGLAAATGTPGPGSAMLAARAGSGVARQLLPAHRGRLQLGRPVGGAWSGWPLECVRSRPEGRAVGATCPALHLSAPAPAPCAPSLRPLHACAGALRLSAFAKGALPLRGRSCLLLSTDRKSIARAELSSPLHRLRRYSEGGAVFSSAQTRAGGPGAPRGQSCVLLGTHLGDTAKAEQRSPQHRPWGHCLALGQLGAASTTQLRTPGLRTTSHCHVNPFPGQCVLGLEPNLLDSLGPSIFGVVGNLVAIVVLCKSRKEQKETTFYTVMWLAATELLFTLLVSQVTIAMYMKGR
ncbi:uncharacterized protein [Gorilla gorilla gorilla]|uniref:uncharacterized protein n=1 Tax=Gorilla gorilla gorilla TaxID=9595 RepID=UPI0030080121